MLVAAPARWDEACFSIPAVRALIASGPGVGILCPEEQMSLWQSLPVVSVIGVPQNARAKPIAARIDSSWQAAWLWEEGPLADAIVRAKVPRRLGPAVGKLTKMLTHPLDARVGPLDHRVRHYLATVESAGMTTGHADFFRPLEITAPTTPRSVLLIPDSDFGPSHEWNPSGWLEVIDHLSQRNCHVAIAIHRGGRCLGEQLVAQRGDQVTAVAIPALAEALPKLATHALTIAADGSLPHLAAYAGCTCITLFGPNDPQWKRPLGKHHAIVRRQVECAPCLLAKCPLDLRCQRELTPSAVVAWIDAKLESI